MLLNMDTAASLVDFVFPARGDGAPSVRHERARRLDGGYPGWVADWIRDAYTVARD
jgi:hypothetical protein